MRLEIEHFVFLHWKLKWEEILCFFTGNKNGKKLRDPIGTYSFWLSWLSPDILRSLGFRRVSELQIRGSIEIVKDNFSYFSMKTYVVTPH